MKSVVQIITGIGIIAALTLVAGAFTEPAAAPPTCLAGNPGCDAPLNIGLTDQIKRGALQVGGLVSSFGVTVGTNRNNDASYLKLDSEEVFPGSGTTPLASDCNDQIEYGRIIFNNANNDLYLCGGNGWYRIHGEKVIQ